MIDDVSKNSDIEASDLQGFKYFNQILPLLKSLREQKAHHNRNLHMDEYVLLLLLYFFNPLMKTLRGLQQTTELDDVKKKLKIKRCSLGALSEAGYVFDAKLLEPLFQELIKRTLEKEGKLTGIEKQLVAVDATIIQSVSKAFWALWLDDEHRAVKLHLELDINNWVPTEMGVTEGNGNEKEVFRKFIKSNKFYVLDSGYARYDLFEEIARKGSDFVVRLRDNAVWKEIEAKELTDADKSEGIQKDIIVRLGTNDPLSAPVRVF